MDGTKTIKVSHDGSTSLYHHWNFKQAFGLQVTPEWSADSCSRTASDIHNQVEEIDRCLLSNVQFGLRFENGTVVVVTSIRVQTNEPKA